MNTQAIPTYMGVGLLAAAALMRRTQVRERQLLVSLGGLSLLYALTTQSHSGQRWPEARGTRPRGFDLASPDTASTTPPHGDVLDEERFASHSPAYAGLDS